MRKTVVFYSILVFDRQRSQRPVFFFLVQYFHYVVSFKVRTHQATSRSNTLRRQIAPCVVENFCENLFSATEFTVAATSHTKSNQTEFVRLVAATNSVAETKICT